MVVYWWFLTGPAEAAAICSGGDDNLTEAETRSQARHKHAIVTRCPVPLVGSAPVPIPSGTRERSREFLEEAFDKSMYCFK